MRASYSLCSLVLRQYKTLRHITSRADSIGIPVPRMTPLPRWAAVQPSRTRVAMFSFRRAEVQTLLWLQIPVEAVRLHRELPLVRQARHEGIAVGNIASVGVNDEGVALAVGSATVLFFPDRYRDRFGAVAFVDVRTVVTGS